jgi:Nitronate monooxygenase
MRRGHRARVRGRRPSRHVPDRGHLDPGRHDGARAAGGRCRAGAGHRRRGIADARGIVAALALGASAVQIGTAYLFCPEARVGAVHRRALEGSKDNGTVLTNVFTGRPARGILNRLVREVGPVSDRAPEFPLAGGAVAPLRASSEARGSGDFVPLWSGQAARLGRELPAGELTRRLAADALARLAALGGMSNDGEADRHPGRVGSAAQGERQG